VSVESACRTFAQQAGASESLCNQVRVVVVARWVTKREALPSPTARAGVVFNRCSRGGHSDMALTLSNLAFFLHCWGKNADAEPLYLDALAMTRGLVGGYAAQKSEGEALTLLATIPDRLSWSVSNSLTLKATPPTVYRKVWTSKALVTRAFEQRQLAARAATDPKATSILADLSTARRRRAELLLISFHCSMMKYYI